MIFGTYISTAAIRLSFVTTETQGILPLQPASQSGSWTHLAVSYDGTKSRIFLNGVLDSEVSSGILKANGSYDVGIGRNLYGGGYDFYLNGYIDELRITKGTARYISAFTVPTKAFPDKFFISSIGTQANTQYFRSSGNFAWYKGGQHSNAMLDPNSGSVQMILNDKGNLLVGSTVDNISNKLQVNGSISQFPLASITPSNIGELVFEATNNTTITVKYKGSDGTVRSGTLTLS